MLTLEKFEEASELVKNVTNPTKLIYSEYLSAQTGAKVYLNQRICSTQELTRSAEHIIRSAHFLRKREAEVSSQHLPEITHRVLHLQQRNSDARQPSLCRPLLR